MRKFCPECGYQMTFIPVPQGYACVDCGHIIEDLPDRDSTVGIE